MLEILLGMISLGIALYLWERFHSFRWIVGFIAISLLILFVIEVIRDREKRQFEKENQNAQIALENEFYKRHPEISKECECSKDEKEKFPNQCKNSLELFLNCVSFEELIELEKHNNLGKNFKRLKFNDASEN